MSVHFLFFKNGCSLDINSSEENLKELKLRNEIDEMERHLVKLGSPVVFCHNDVLVHNIIYNEEKGEKYVL